MKTFKYFCGHNFEQGNGICCKNKKIVFKDAAVYLLIGGLK